MSDLLPNGITADAPILTAEELVRRNPAMRPVLIEGLLRRGELLSINAAPKVGKSYLALSLAAAVATGGEWLGRRCERGTVILIDCELHEPTLAQRIQNIATAMSLPGDWGKDLHIIAQRGLPCDIERLLDRTAELAALRPTLLVIDPIYKLLGTADENSNSDMGRILAFLDALAADTGAAIALVHHVSKGSQGARATYEVGAGASAVARAVDTHLAIRPLRTAPDAFGVSAIVRSFPPVQPFAVRRAWPLFVVDPSLDPTAYEGAKASSATAQMTPEILAGIVPRHIAGSDWKTRGELIIELADAYAVSQRKAEAAIKLAVGRRLVKLERRRGAPVESRATKYVRPVV